MITNGNHPIPANCGSATQHERLSKNDTGVDLFQQPSSVICGCSVFREDVQSVERADAFRRVSVVEIEKMKPAVRSSSAMTK